MVYEHLHHTGGGGRSSSPCNLISLTAWGEVTVYSVSVTSVGEGAADVDLGMRIGSRVRLLRTTGQIKLGMLALQQPPTTGQVGADGAEAR